MGKNVTISTLPNIGQNYLPKINTSSIFANSLVYDDGSSVLINTTTASAFKLDVNGSIRATSGTLTGALSGTSATFSGDVNITNSSNAQIGFNTTGALNTTGAYLYYNRSGSNKWTSGMGPVDGSNDFQIATGSVKALNLTVTTGAATFSSSVTAGGTVFAPNTNTDPTTGNATNNGTVYALNAASTNNSYGIGLGAIRNSAYDMWFQTGVINGGGYRFYIGTSEKVTIDKSGNVGIGTTSPNKGGVNKALTLNAATSTNASYELSVNDILQGSLYTNISDTSVRLANFNSGDIVLVTGATSTERMRITSGGNVGIGTTSPDTYSYGGSRKFLTFQANLTNEEPFLQLIANGAGNSLIDFGNATIRRATIIGEAGSNLVFLTNGSNSGTTTSERARITSGGQIFLYNLSASAGTNAARYSTATGQLTYDTSSARYKDNIRDSGYGLSDVLKLKSRMFEYKEDNRTDIGLIAEEVISHIPELVGLDKSGQADSISYDRFVSVLVKAIQELKAELDTLKNK